MHDGRQYLIDSFSICTRRATIYALCHARGGSEGGSSLVLGVPDANTPFILDELRSVAARLPGADLYVGEEATVDVLRAKAEGRRVVHIAAHGFFRPDNPMFSGIRLGSGSCLTLYDLYNLTLPAEMVVLSACVTASTYCSGRTSCSGWPAACCPAGAASLLLTLWEVPDQSTARVQGRRSTTGSSPAPNRAAALREASPPAIREQYPHPIHWAPFVLMGKALAT